LRSFVLSATTLSLFLIIAPLSAVSAPSWEPATASGVTAGAHHETFIVEATLTLPQNCYAARIRSTPISLHTPRSFYVEQLAPSSPCASKTAYKCTVVSPDFPLPIPHQIEVVSKGPQRSKVTVSTEEEPNPAPPLCRKG
jgi:hypothetical protein